MSRRLFCYHCGAAWLHVVGNACHACGRYCYDGSEQPKANLAIWVDGPDSEAARAGRQKRCCGGSRKPGHEPGCDLYEPDCRAMPSTRERRRLLAEWSHSYGNRHRDAGFEPDDDFADYVFRHAFRLARETEARTPDPDHVPAVRRVVVFDGGRGTRRKARHAYWDAALELLWRAAVRWPKSVDPKRWWDYWNDTRTRRLADALRHRDEEAGYR